MFATQELEHVERAELMACVFSSQHTDNAHAFITATTDTARTGPA